VSSDKRRFPRLKTSCSIRYRVVESGGGSGAQTEAQTVNISRGGACFSSGTRLEAGTMLAIEMDLAEFESPVVALGRVAWCEPGGSGYEIGTEFWWIGWGDDGAERSIGDYVQRTMESESD